MGNKLRVVPFGPSPREKDRLGLVFCVGVKQGSGHRMEPLTRPAIKLEKWMYSLVLTDVFSCPYPFLSSCLAGKFSHPEIVQLVSELEAERNASITAAASEPRS